MFAVEGPANTLSYLVAGYVVIFGSMAAYLVSLIVRFRNLKQDMDMFQELEKKENKK